MSDEPATIGINFAGKDGARLLIHLPWMADRKLKDYLRTSALRGRGLLHVAIRSKVRSVERPKVRLTDTLRSGEIIFIMSRV